MHDIFILTDSLALPRNKPEKCEWSKTWPNLLRLHGYTVYQVSIGGATIGELQNQYLYHKDTPSKILLIQSGIVDCTPRFLSRNSVNILKSLPIIGSLILRILNKPMIRRVRKITYTPLNDFKRKMISIKNNSTIPVYCIGIGFKSYEYEAILPGITNNVEKYNLALKEIFENNFIDISKMGQESFMSDFHHLTEIGHDRLLKLILEKL